MARRIASAPGGKTGAVEQTVSFGNLSEMQRESRGYAQYFEHCLALRPMGSALDIETIGDDEHDAARAVEQAFSSHDTSDASGSVTERNL